MSPGQPPMFGARSNKRRHTERDRRVLAEIGGRVRAARNERSLSQGELAARASCAQATISNIEQGRYAADIITLLSVAEAMDLGLCALLTDL